MKTWPQVPKAVRALLADLGADESDYGQILPRPITEEDFLRPIHNDVVRSIVAEAPRLKHCRLEKRMQAFDRAEEALRDYPDQDERGRLLHLVMVALRLPRE